MKEDNQIEKVKKLRKAITITSSIGLLSIPLTIGASVVALFAFRGDSNEANQQFIDFSTVITTTCVLLLIAMSITAIILSIYHRVLVKRLKSTDPDFKDKPNIAFFFCMLFFALAIFLIIKDAIDRAS